MALPQMNRLNDLVRRKRNLVAMYKKYLEGVEGIEFPLWNKNCFVNPHRANILVDDPESLIKYLQKNNMGARRFYYPVHRYPTYKTGQSLPNTEYAFDHGVSLPSAPFLDEPTVRKISAKVKEFMKNQ
jgi:dTDP-4-amino-4,6-dideoxygalactose transaminase